MWAHKEMPDFARWFLTCVLGPTSEANLAVHVRVDLSTFLCASRFRRAPLYPSTPYR
jgi:hypothetical protein